MAKILQLSQERNLANLNKYLDGLKPEELTSNFRQTVLSGKTSDVANFLHAVFQGSPPDSEKGVARCLHLCKCSLGLLGSQELSTKMASEITGYLLIEIDKFPASSLVQLAEVFTDIIRSKDITNGKALELLPKVISSLAAMEMVATDNGRMSGKEFKDHLLNNLCSCRWEARCAIHLASVFREVTLSSDQLKFVINKLLRMLKYVEVQELPPLVYQLLLLSSKGHKRVVVEGLVAFFSEQDRALQQQQQRADGHEGDAVETSAFSQEQLRHTEGTIIVHITFSIKQDQDLGREFIKFLKAGQQRDCSTVLAPFSVALALSVAQIHRFEEQIFDFLKATILKSLKDAKRHGTSPWISDLVAAGQDVTKLILETVKNSLYGWDHVMQGLVQLGFTLMDAFGPKPGPFGGKGTEVRGAPSTPNQQASQLGARILLELFKSQETVRSDVLEQILNRVVTRTAGSASQYINLLSSMVSSAPQTVLDCMGKVREAFDYLAYLPALTAEGLLKAFQPLMRLNVTLKDSLMLVLRKAMFSRQGEARKIAVLGYLQILKHFRVYGSLPLSQSSQSYSMMTSTSSQVQVDIHGNSRQPPNYEAIVCMEILGNMRRCLTQQADIRLVLYEGLYEVLCRNSHLQGSILDLLLGQFKSYYESDEDVQPPIKLQPCITTQGNNVFTAEPLAHLLQTLVQSLLRCQLMRSRHKGEEWAEELDDDDEGEESKQVLTRLEEMMDSLTHRMVTCELEDFQVDKSADFSTSTGVGTRNNLFATLLLGVNEVLMEYVFTRASSSDFKTEDVERILALYKKCHQIADILREKSGKGKGGSSSTSKAHKSLLSMACLANMMTALYSDEIPAHQEGIDLLRKNADFCRYVVSAAVQKMEQMKEKGECEGPQGTQPSRLYQHCCTIARVFLTKFSSGLRAHEDKSKKSKSVVPLCLQGLSTAVSVVCSFFPDKLVDFLHCVDPTVGEDRNKEPVSADDDIECQEQIHLHVKKYQRIVMDILTGGDDVSTTTKDAIPLCHIIEMVVKHVSPRGAQFAQVQSWVTKVCTELSIDDISLCKVVINLLFAMTTKMKSPVGLLRDVAEDIHTQVGDVDAEVEVEDRTHFAIINSKTATPTILLLWMHQADQVLDDTEWLVTRLKAEIQAAQADVVDTPNQLSTQREDTEKSICNHLGMLVTGFHELVQTAIPAGPCIDTTLKSLTRLYATFTTLCKFYLVMYAQKSGQMSGRFEKLVRLSGTHLTKYVYGLITHVQQIQSEKLAHQAAGKSGKSKDKKKGDKGLVSSALTAGKARVVMRETRPIPNLIYAIEQYESFLIKLSKKTKTNLLADFKLSTSRDFRINTAMVQANLAEQASDSDEDETDAELNGQEEEEEEREEVVEVDDDGEEVDKENNGQPPAKKRRGPLSRR
ncbi:Fanconi anemia group I protein-like [Diadema antillarum]|uniref:Fanconi anemia group I protein-like n=1 Tax=Diadema antillarum TaxID=105358 RepID=UPI003A875ED3